MPDVFTWISCLLQSKNNQQIHFSKGKFSQKIITKKNTNQMYNQLEREPSHYFAQSFINITLLLHCHIVNSNYVKYWLISWQWRTTHQQSQNKNDDWMRIISLCPVLLRLECEYSSQSQLDSCFLKSKLVTNDFVFKFTACCVNVDCWVRERRERTSAPLNRFTLKDIPYSHVTKSN